MESTPKSVVFFFLSLLVCTCTLAQNTQQTIGVETTTSATLPFYKWEIGLDALPLIDKAKDSFGYVLKRNFQGENGRQAVRLKLLPRFGHSNVGGSVSNSSIYVAVGYEWQKIYGRFAVLYGLEPFFRYENNISVGQVTNYRTQVKNTYVGSSGFIGGRYYLGNHFSLTVESHLIYNYHKGSTFNIGNASSGMAREHTLSTNPIHSFFLSYHF